MRQEAEHGKRVVDYYNAAQLFYEHLWYGRTALGLHYGFWDRNVSNRKQAILRENEVLAEFANVKRGDLVLDAGSGVGGSGIWLAENRGANVVRLNIVHKQLKIGHRLAEKSKLLKSSTFVEGDYQKLPFRSSLFDVVWSLESIEHATNINAFIHEAHRVLKPDGKIIVAGTFKGRKDLSAHELDQLEVGMNAAGAFNDFRTAGEVDSSMRDEGFEMLTNLNVTNLIMESSRQMASMCRTWMPAAKAAVTLRVTPKLMLSNQHWGTYQEGLFKSGAISYNILLAQKT